ncbi:MAG: hypothetical protein PVJ67_02940 [Candidatus Pacearchaeota archaeon]|jgi:predicted GH43/DUF377 family glycosyl hydrolase
MAKKNLSKERILATLKGIAEKRFGDKKNPKKKRVKKKTHIVRKSPRNPIISPKSDNAWEAWQTFNPAAILIDDKVHLLYRAIGHDAISRLGYASSVDGFLVDERFPDPAYEHRTGQEGKYVCYSIASGGSWGGCEDPRIVRVGNEDKLYITYTACDGGLRVGLSSISLEDFKNKKWKWSKPQLISPAGQVNKNWIIFPEKINGKYAILHSISPKISIAYVDDLDNIKEPIESHYHPGKPEKRWDSFVRGPGPPPIKTDKGWLLFYHAMNHKDMSQYKMGAMLLDLNDPTKVLYRSKEPLLVPEECYENEGFKSGVVYALGAVVRGEDLLIYYGGADSHVCVAHVNLDKLLKSLTKKTIKLPKLKFLNFGKLLKS